MISFLLMKVSVALLLYNNIIVTKVVEVRRKQEPLAAHFIH